MMRLHILPVLWCLAAAAHAAAPADRWPVVRGEPAQRGIAGVALQVPLQLKWTYKAADPILATPVTDGERAYFGDGDGTFHAVKLSDGTAAWTFVLTDPKTGKPSKDPIEGSAALVGEHVIFGGTDGIVRALAAATGQEAWQHASTAEIKAGVTPFTAGDVPAVVVAGFGGEVLALKAADGTPLWTFDAGGPIAGAASVGEAGVVFGGCNGTIDVLDPLTGKQKQRIDIKIYMPNSVALHGAHGYFAHSGNKIEAWDLLQAKALWSFQERDFPYFTSPAVSDDVVIAGGDGKRLHCLKRADGSELWSFRARDKITSSPVISGDLVFFGSDDGRLYALGLADGGEKWSYEIGAAVKSSPAVINGLVLVGADDGAVYAFAPGGS